MLCVWISLSAGQLDASSVAERLERLEAGMAALQAENRELRHSLDVVRVQLSRARDDVAGGAGGTVVTARLEMPLSPVEQIACLLRESRSSDSLLILPLLLAAAGGSGTPGTFVELGAYDGERLSQTVHLERCFGWRGLLLEANPTNFAAIASKQRDLSIALHSAVCSKRGTVLVGNADSTVTGIEGVMSKSHQSKWRRVQGASVPVPCAPLGELMKEAGFPKVTFLSLDVEGAELDTLQSLHLLEQGPPFSVLLVETSRYDGSRNGQILQLLKHNGTGLAQHSHPHFAGSQNALFADHDLKQRPLNHSATLDLAKRARAPGFIAALRALNVSFSTAAQVHQVASAVPEVLAAALSAHDVDEPSSRAAQ